MPADDDDREFDAIILPPAMLTDEHSSLLVIPGVLAVDAEAQLGNGEVAETVIITRLVEQTLTFERYEFIPVE